MPQGFAVFASKGIYFYSKAGALIKNDTIKHLVLMSFLTENGILSYL